MTSSGYHRLIAEARKRLDDENDVEAVLALIRSSDLTLMSSIGAVRDLFGVDPKEAKRMVLDSPAFADVRGGFDAYWEAIAEAEDGIPE